MNEIDTLKADGKAFEAGMVAYRTGRPRQYGCHFGMRSTLEMDRHDFNEGWDYARAEQIGKDNAELAAARRPPASPRDPGRTRTRALPSVPWPRPSPSSPASCIGQH